MTERGAAGDENNGGSVENAEGRARLGTHQMQEWGRGRGVCDSVQGAWGGVGLCEWGLGDAGSSDLHLSSWISSQFPHFHGAQTLQSEPFHRPHLLWMTDDTGV